MGQPNVGRGTGATGGRGIGYPQSHSAGRGSQGQQGGRGFVSSQVAGMKRPLTSQTRGRGGTHIPFLPRANSALSEYPQEDTYEAYNDHCQAYNGHYGNEETEEELLDEFPPSV